MKDNRLITIESQPLFKEQNIGGPGSMIIIGSDFNGSPYTEDQKRLKREADIALIDDVGKAFKKGFCK